MSDSLLHYLQTQQIDPAPILQRLDKVERPIGRWLGQQLNKKERPLLIGINGAQGTGKSTFAAILQLLLRDEFSLQSVILSIDNYYLGRNERKQLSEQVHLLLKTRGVPGTHNLTALNQQLDQLLHIQPNEQITLARFDKATDDCTDEQIWYCPPSGLDLILFEGWCVGAPPQSVEALDQPVNLLEKQSDSDGQWRSYINQQLMGAYQTLFARLDHLLVLQAPNIEAVVEWRLLQEQKLREGRQEEGVDAEQIRYFVSHFERLTYHMLAELPQLADVVLPVGENHQIEKIEMRQEWIQWH